MDYLADSRKKVNNLLQQNIIAGKSISELKDLGLKSLDDNYFSVGDNQGSIFYDDPRLPMWQKFFRDFSALTDVTNWYFGRWINAGWNEPLPYRIVINEQFRKEFRGIPFLYVWRLNVMDVATAIPGAALAAEKKIAERAVLLLKDFGWSTTINYGLAEFSGPPRALDEEDDGGQRSMLTYLSKTKLRDLGYVKINGSPITYERSAQGGGVANDGRD